jgi:hypothetical protein
MAIAHFIGIDFIHARAGSLDRKPRAISTSMIIIARFMTFAPYGCAGCLAICVTHRTITSTRGEFLFPFFKKTRMHGRRPTDRRIRRTDGKG